MSKQTKISVVFVHGTLIATTNKCENLEQSVKTRNNRNYERESKRSRLRLP
jgi:hypothetical protein